MVLSTALPYVCSVCEELFTSKAEKATPRHHCEGDNLGKTGVGLPSPDHPDYKPPPELTEGDVELDIPDMQGSSGIPTIGIDDISPKPVKPKPEKRKPEPPQPVTDTTKASSERLAVMNRAVLAMLAGDVDKETAMILLTELWSGTVDIEVHEAVKVEVSGGYYVISIAIISAFLIAAVFYNQKKQEAMRRLTKTPDPEDKW
tara:strand:+ start:80 stop:685 length:606 start_codon:yes stop_codon:yes gene_type:complete